MRARDKEGSQRTSSRQGILEADIERRVRKACESHSRLADNIFGAAVVVPNCVLDLQEIVSAMDGRVPVRPRGLSYTYVHIDDLSIAFTSPHSSSHNDQCVSVHEVPYASLILRTVARLCE